MRREENRQDRCGCELLTVEGGAYSRRSGAALNIETKARRLEIRKAGRRTLIPVAALDRMLDGLLLEEALGLWKTMSRRLSHRAFRPGRE